MSFWSAIIAFTDFPVTDISPVFVIVPVFLANIAVELLESSIFISAAVVKLSVASVYIPTLDSPFVIVNFPLVVPSNFTTPSFIKTRLFFLPFVEVRLKLFTTKGVVPALLKKTAVAFSLSDISTFKTDSLVVAPKAILTLSAVLWWKFFPASRFIYPKKANPIALFPVIFIGLFNNISPLV